MAKEFKWDKPNITVNDIITGLVKQYGPEQPISIDLEDKKTPIQYKSSMIPVVCNRCGNRWSTSPYILLKGYYMFGYVCSFCGNLSDADLRDKKKKEMNDKAIELIKEQYGDDVFEKDEAAEKEKEAELEAEKEISKFSEEDLKDALETTDKEDYSEYMADDEETSSIGESLDKSSESFDIQNEESGTESFDSEEEDDNPFEGSDEYEVVDADDLIKETEEKLRAENEEAIKEISKKAEEEKIKAVEKAKDEVALEMSKKAQENEAKIRDEMAAKMKAELEKEKAKMKAEIEAAKKAQENAEKYAAEMNAKNSILEEEISDMESDLDPDPNVTYKDDETSEDFYDEDLESEDYEEESEESGTEPFDSEEEFDSLYEDVDVENPVDVEKSVDYDTDLGNALEEIRDSLGFNPWSKDSIKIDETDGSVKEVECIICKHKSKFKNIGDLSDIVYIGDKFCDRYGIDKSKRINNRSSVPIMHKCDCCLDSVINNGYNEYYKSAITNLAEEAHLNIINVDKRMFIPNSDEYYEVECNGVVKGLYRTELLKFIDKDARTDPMFKPSEESNESKSVKSTESTNYSEKPVTVLKSKKVNESKESYTNTSQSYNNPNVRILKPKKKEESVTTEQKSDTNSSKTFEEKMSEKYNKGPFVENSVDSNTSLEEEKYIEEEEIRKNSPFKRNHKLVLDYKSIAKLNGKINPFERESTLKEEFQESIFCKFISDLSDETGVECYLNVNEKTFEIPVIDFESGYRIICADLNERAIPNVIFEYLADKKRLPFHYFNETAEDDGTGVLRKRPKNFKWMILYSDSIEERRDATMMALIKFINPKILAYGGQRIKIEDLDYEYTQHDQYLRDFDVRFSTFPSGKPKTGQLGIIVTWNSSKQVTSKDVLNFQMQISAKDTLSNLNSLENDYSQYMCCSIRYIEKFNKDTNRVIYDITEYVEIGTALIADGLKQCVRALLKEYQMKYTQLKGIPPHIIIECDQNVFMSPSIRNYINDESLIPVDESYKQMVYGSQYQSNRGVEQFKRYCYVRLPEYRTRQSDSMRTDLRMFSTSTLVKKMSDEIKQAGIQNTIADPNVRNLFIKRMGFVKCHQAEIKEYFFNQSMVSSLMIDANTICMRKHIEADSMFQASNMVTDQNLGIGINNIFTNPALISKYQRIMTNGTEEAKQYMMGTMFNQNPNMYYQMQSMNPNGFDQQMNNVVGMNPMMGMTNPMMGMPMGMGF